MEMEQNPRCEEGSSCLKAYALMNTIIMKNNIYIFIVLFFSYCFSIMMYFMHKTDVVKPIYWKL